MKYAVKTIAKIATARAAGAEIIENRNFRFTGKHLGFSRVEPLARTNSRLRGWHLRIVWACYR